MRFAAAACALALLVCVAIFGAVLAHRATAPSAPPAAAAGAGGAPPAPTQTATQIATAPPTAAPAPPVAATASPAPDLTEASAPPPAQTVNCPGNPDALGISRVIEIDTTGGPGFGFEHFKQYDFLQPGEVALTFDDGPWPQHTPAVLAALAANCTKAVFFPIGEHTMWNPSILRQVAAAGHTIGSHTWSHKDLSKLSFQDAKDEVEKGVSAVRWALGAPATPFFRFPALKHPPDVVTYLGQRNIAIFSTDMDSFDFRIRKPEQVINSVMTKLKKNGKGIILLHDFQKATSEAAPELLKQLKQNGYRAVFLKAKEPVETIAAYDELIAKEIKLPTVTNRPTSDVVHTIE